MMLSGIFALFFRSLRGDSRSLWVHVSWVFLLIVIYILMSIAQVQSQFFGAPGLLFFKYVIFCNAVFLTLLGIGYFSSVISEEKEEDTLGLMTMAGISPIGILLGKSTTRLFQVFLLLAVQYPFTLLSITLGGLMPDQIFAGYAALLAYTILLANVGLFCSVLCRRNRDASGLTTLWMVAYLFVPLFAYGGYMHFLTGAGSTDPSWSRFAPILSPVFFWISETNVFGQLAQITETGYKFTWTPQLISNSIGGMFFFLASWWMFGLVSHDPAPESTTRAMVPRKTGRLRLFSAGRTWDASLIWKDFHFTAGGWFGILIRCGLYVGLYWLSFATSFPWFDRSMNATIRWSDVTLGYQFFVVPLFVVDCAMCISRVFQEEIRHQTLSALLMLPRTVPHIVYTKLLGCFNGLLPGLIGVIVAFTLLEEQKKALWEIVQQPVAYWFAVNLLLVIHLSATLSTYLRWGAFALSIALTIGSMIVTIMILELAGMRQLDILGIVAVPLLGVCAACHLIVLLRLPFLGEK